MPKNNTRKKRSYNKKGKIIKNKKNIKLTKESNNNIMNCLNAYGHLMNVNLDNNKFINLLYKSLNNASKETKKIVYQSLIEPINVLNLSSSYFLDKTIISNLRKTLDYSCKVNFTIFDFNYCYI